MTYGKLITKLGPILSNKEIEVVLKRLNNKHITQTESNYLSRSVRPKLRSAEFAASAELLSLLDYRRRRYEREDNLLRKKIINSINDIGDIKAVILFGSYIRNKHTNYRDIDVMVVLNRKLWGSSAEKNRMEEDIEKVTDVKTDVNLVSYKELVKLFPYSPLLQTELEEYKIIYGDMRLSRKIITDKPYLYRKLLETEYVLELGRKIKPRYIYNAIRACIAIKLFLDKKVDNKLIIKTIIDNIGKLTADNLINNGANQVQKDIALKYLRYLYNELMKVLKE